MLHHKTQETWRRHSCCSKQDAQALLQYRAGAVALGRGHHFAEEQCLLDMMNLQCACAERQQLLTYAQKSAGRCLANRIRWFTVSAHVGVARAVDWVLVDSSEVLGF